MKNKLLLALTALLLVGSLSACSLFNAPSSTAASTATTSRTLQVSGDGKVYLVPDLAYIDIGVQTSGSKVTDALSSNTTQAQAIAKALEAQGVDAKDIQTSNFSISPQQNVDPTTGKTAETTYLVNNTVYVTVRDLTKLGTILDAVTTSGANVINSISFDSTKSDDATTQARKAAIANARAQAQTLADAAGVTLDTVQTVSVSNQSPVTLYDVKSASVANGSNSSSVPVSAGQILIEATANLTYTLK